MIKYVDYDIVFQEIPDEITLAINISCCPHRCKGCHSPHLQKNIGKMLNQLSLSKLVKKYEGAITCICFMGGDADPEEVCRLAYFVRQKWKGNIKTAWYSGSKTIYDPAVELFNFIKIGPYIESIGGLDVKGTNQRLFHITDGIVNDITFRMQSKP